MEERRFSFYKIAYIIFFISFMIISVLYPIVVSSPDDTWGIIILVTIYIFIVLMLVFRKKEGSDLRKLQSVSILILAISLAILLIAWIIFIFDGIVFSSEGYEGLPFYIIGMLGVLISIPFFILDWVISKFRRS